MASSKTEISFTVTHRGTAHAVTVLSTSTVASLRTELAELTGVPSSLQKLLYKGKKASVVDETFIRDAGIKNGMKIQMLGSTLEEIGGLQAEENEQQRKNRVMRERAMKTPVKLRSTGSASASTMSYRFHAIEPLQHLPNPSSAASLLTRLSNDPAILYIMQKHKFSVGKLTELAPHENPELLGLNMNAGQVIKLRIRTDAYDGFRLYPNIRMVLCHELTHNVWADHDNDFKELNSQLNKEVVEFERKRGQATHSLLGSGDVYEPSSEQEAEAHAQAYVLGGDGSSSFSLSDSNEDRRNRMLNAAMNRMRKDEEEIEETCGTAGPATGTGGSSK